jgi:acyl-CoA thioesterase
MGETDDQACAERVVAAMAAGDGLARWLGVAVEAIAPRRVRLSMTVRDDMLNAHGLCHGGVLFGFADIAFAFACNNENRSALALHAAIDFAAAAKPGETLVAEAAAARQSARFGLYDVRVTAGDGRPVALFRGTAFRVGGETLVALGVSPTVTDR